MEYAEGRLGRVFVLRLEDGDTIPSTIEDFAADKGIRAAFCAVLGGIEKGTLVVGPEDGSASPIVAMLQQIENVHEAAAVGTIFPSESGAPTLHMHAALGREDSSRTGCVRMGLDVWKVCEVVLVELEGIQMERRLDRVTGFEVLTARHGRQA